MASVQVHESDHLQEHLRIPGSFGSRIDPKPPVKTTRKIEISMDLFASQAPNSRGFSMDLASPAPHPKHVVASGSSSTMTSLGRWDLVVSKYPKTLALDLRPHVVYQGNPMNQP